MRTKPLVHSDAQVSDERLAKEAQEDFLKDRSKQVTSILIDVMRENQFPNLTYADLHRRFPARKRMAWLEQRPDVRADFSTKIAGTPAKTARKRTGVVQADNAEEVVENGDRSHEDFELSIESETLSTYGDCEEYFQFLLEGFDWKDTKNKARQRAIARMLNEFLARSNDLKPILTHLEFRRAIPSTVWHMFVPLELRAEVDEARLAKLADKPKEPWTAEEELKMATPDKLVDDNIPLEELRPVFELAMKSMGFRLPKDMPKKEEEPASEPKKLEEPAASDQKPDATTVAPGPISSDGPKGDGAYAPAPPPLPTKAGPIMRSPSSSGIRVQGAPMPPPTGDKAKDDFDLDKAIDQMQTKEGEPAPKAKVGS